MYSTPNGAQEQTEKERRAEAKVDTREKSGNLTAKERGMTTTTPVKRRRKKSNLPARKGDPSSHTTLCGNVVRRLPLLGSRRSTHGPLLQRRQKKLPSIHERRRPSRPRLCPR